MGSVKSPVTSPADEHDQNRLFLGILLVVAINGNYPQPDRLCLLGPVAVFASLSGRNQAITFNGGCDWSRITVESDAHQLADAGRLSSYPTRCAGRNVAFHAAHLRMRRVLMANEFRLHHMARLPAKLKSFHMAHPTKCALTGNHNVQDGVVVQKE